MHVFLLRLMLHSKNLLLDLGKNEVTFEIHEASLRSCVNEDKLLHVWKPLMVMLLSGLLREVQLKFNFLILSCSQGCRAVNEVSLCKCGSVT